MIKNDHFYGKYCGVKSIYPKNKDEKDEDFWVLDKDEGRKDGKCYQCPRCDKAFIVKYKLKEHISLVHDEMKRHTCDKCGKTFGRLSDLNRHYSSVHEGLRNHQCDQCDKAYGQYAHLKGQN